MNNPEKKISVNVSSLVDLKAELIRKQKQFREECMQKKAGEKVVKAPAKKGGIWSKQNAGILARAQKDLEAKTEEDSVLEKSRSTLEAKAKLYEQMTRRGNVPEEDGSEGFLVDFQGKAIDSALAERQRQHEEEESSKKHQEQEEHEDLERRLQEAVPAPADSDEEWVDYTDSSGKSRRCMKKDFSDLSKLEARETSKKMREKDLMSSDMYREMLREKWETEEQAMLDKPAGPVHYSNVRFDEVRTHGVGFYSFSKDETERQEQMDTLRKLQEQTKEQRAKHESLKAKRKAILKARLAKVKKRRMIQDGVEGDMPDGSEEEDENMIGPKATEAKEPEPLTRDESLRKDKPIRDWDRGKKAPEMKSYEESRREERIEEFAPPQDLYGKPAPASSRPPSTLKTTKKIHVLANTNMIKPPADPMAALEQQQESTHNTDAMARLEHKAKVSADPMASLDRKVSAAKNDIVSGMDAREARKKANFERLDQLIGARLSSMRADMEQDTQISKSASSSGNMESSGRSSYPTSSVNNASSSNTEGETNETYPVYSPNTFPVPSAFPGVTLPDTSVPPPGMFPTAPVYPFHSTSGTAEMVNMNGIDFSQPPPPPPSEPHPPPSTSMPHPPPSTLIPESYPAPPYPEPHLCTQGHTVDLHGDQGRHSSMVSHDSASKPVPSQVVISAAPQLKAAKPVYYNSNKGLMPDIVKQAPRYERVHLHEVPASLPAPPTEGSAMEYPSQEQVHGAHRQEQASMNAWQRQYDNKSVTMTSRSVKPNTNPGLSALKPDNIPFVSPFVQKKDDAELMPVINFDSTKTPPEN